MLTLTLMLYSKTIIAFMEVKTEKLRGKQLMMRGRFGREKITQMGRGGVGLRFHYCLSFFIPLSDKRIQKSIEPQSIIY